MTNSQIGEQSRANEPYRKAYVFTLVINAALGSFFFGFTLAVFNPIQNFITTSCVPAGAAIGGLIAGSLSNSYGRKNAMRIIDLVTIVGIFMEVLSSKYLLILGRLLNGLCLGLNCTLVPIYISEVSPISVKGVAGTFNQLFLSIGMLVAFVLGLGVPKEGSDPDSNWWRVMLGFPLITCTIRILLLTFVFREDTPRYSIARGKDEEAIRALQKIYKGDYSQEIFDSLKRENEILSSQGKMSYSELFSPNMRKRVFAGVVLAIFQQLVGMNAIVFYSVTIFEQQSSGDEALAQIYTAVVGIIGLVAAIFASFIISKVGRKTILFTGCTLMGITMTLFSILSYESDGKSDLLKYCIFVYTGAFGFSLGPVVWIYVSEVLPDLGVGIATLMNWISSFIIAQGFPYLLKAFGQNWCFVPFAVTSFLGCIFVLTCLKETKDKSDVEISRAFDPKEKKVAELNGIEASVGFLNDSTS